MEFEASLGYTIKPYLDKTKQNKQTNANIINLEKKFGIITGVDRNVGERARGKRIIRTHCLHVRN